MLAIHPHTADKLSERNGFLSDAKAPAGPGGCGSSLHHRRRSGAQPSRSAAGHAGHRSLCWPAPTRHPETSAAGGDGPRHFQGEPCLSDLRAATDDTDGLVCPEVLDQPGFAPGAVTSSAEARTTGSSPVRSFSKAPGSAGGSFCTEIDN